MKWTLGLITAPRSRGYFLDKTLESMTGMPSPVIFAEPGSVIPDTFQGQVVHRRTRFGDWTNWAVALYELLLSSPDTDYFLMVEDDCVFCKNIIPYLEYTLPLIPEFAYISLYTGEEYHYPKIRGFHDEGRGWDTRSTVCILLHRDKARTMLSNEGVMAHRWASRETFDDNSSKDSVLGKWAEEMGLPVYFHSPSLTQHIGWDSTLLWASSKGYTDECFPKAKEFVGEDFDVADWIGEPPDVRRFRSIRL